jgi:ERCC4-type nuclease|tara:strand:- start:3738 stop:4433 length:696 start_codon:yes stop_codon:yes gene_type:complete
MHVLRIDSREESELSERVLEKAQALNIKAEKEWLDIGDYVFNSVCFEAKSSFDFLQSIMTKRLWNQMDNMDRAFDDNLVIVYGSFDAAFRTYATHTKTTMDKRAYRTLLHRRFYGSMGRIILDYDCNLIWCKDANTAAEIICTVCKMQPHDREVYAPRIVKRITTTDLRADVLCTIKGVSPKKAEDLLKKFGSIMEIGEATTEEICEIEGIGKVLAARIIKTLHTENKMEI